jgi:chromatin segregation and condensation protein Rec8/ScpA/Scc1 (kleisin family)
VESEVIKSAFDPTNRRIRQHLRDSRFGEARDTIEKYIAENVNPLEVDLDELSRIYIRYVNVLKRQYDLATLGKVFLKQVEPTLKIA